MLNIDGLASGLDTTTIIEGLLSIQQQQVDRFDLRKQEVEDERTAFEEIETRMLTLQSTLSELSAPRTNAFLRKQVTPSDETVIEATVSNDAANGVYALTVNSLAKNHQVASNSFASRDATLPDGTITISVGTGGSEQSINLGTDAGGNLEGLAEKINRDIDGVNASIIRDSTGFRLLLSGERSGAATAITVVSTATNPGDQASMPTFDFDNPVQANSDAEVQLGSGAGAILIQNDSNQIDELFDGVTMNLLKASEGQEIQLAVSSDTVAAADAVQSFVDAYNGVIEYTNEQTKFDAEADSAGTLFSNRSLRSVRDDLSSMITQAVPGISKSAGGSRFNRLTNLGIRLENDGTLSLREDELNRVLSGQEEGIGQDEINRLLGFAADSDDPSVQFLSATTDTQPSDDQPYTITVTRAAAQATLEGNTALASSIVVDGTNNELSIAIDGFSTDEDEPITLTQGTYTREELADHLEEVISNADGLTSREVRVSIVDDKLQIRSLSYGTVSRVNNLGGSALSTLGLTEEDNAIGSDVQGSFSYLKDGETKTEQADGSGRILRGDRANERTSGMSVRVTHSQADISAGGGQIESEFSVTLGIAARLDGMIDDLTNREDNNKGQFAIAFEEFDGRINSLDQALDRLNAQFESQEESLLRQFTGLETRISELQGMGNIVAAQFASLSSFGG